MATFTLRKMTIADVAADTLLLDLPVVATRRTLAAMNRYCQRQGWRWIPDTSIYGGHYAAADGTAYLIT